VVGGGNDNGRADEADVLELFRAYRRTGDQSIRAALVERFSWIGVAAARRFTKRGESLEDLMQVAAYGIVKAVDRFDPDYGSPFSSFAFPTVIGELRRHFRDTTWSLNVGRRAKELHWAMTRAVEELTHELQRSPRVDEIARRLRVDEDDVVEAIQAGHSHRPALFDAFAELGATMARAVRDADDDLAIDRAADRVAVRQALARIPPREQQILYFRFFEGLTQSEIAAKVGVSQVHVSRLLQSSLARCRRQLIDDAEGAGRARAPTVDRRRRGPTAHA
jgi:RNA polymerase sigma-B factor